MNFLSRFIKLFTLALTFVFANSVMAFNLPMYTNPATPIIVTQDIREFAIQLPSQAGTGYSWTLINDHQGFIRVKNHEYQQYLPGTPGSGGAEVWKLKVDRDAFDAPHKMSITFVYQRPWNHKIAKTVTFNIYTR